ncbi:SGNH/GDSL hydrolase family protein [Kitasatospora nipponensis]|uniref:SGNH/GDSL hydrolase family protein n=1 Tax=Kitasatospora nipponensis TaxID=258049 RepID=A0ABP4H0A1_9ACTN
MTAPTRPARAHAHPATGTVRFAALGDSLTEGVGAPTEQGWRGWSALLAPSLAADPSAVQHHNLATSGALAGDLAQRQLPAALALRPHVAAVLAGGNDTLRAGFDIGGPAAALDRPLAELSGAGAVLLTACLPDPGRLLGLPAPLARPLARRIAAVNTVVHELSERHHAVHLHLADLPWLTQRGLLSADRLHPSPLGHLLIARRYHAALGESGFAVGAEPATVLAPPPPSRAAELWWLATKGTAWLARRSVDLLPGRLALPAAEAVHRLRGTVAELEARAQAAAEAAVRALPPEHRLP